jgi:hypothetical protein
MTGEQVERYITEELGETPKHNCEALASAINDIADEIDYDKFALMQLLMENKPIDGLHTHSYGFHTASGRSIINGIQNKYYEYENGNY